jgi:hypothetical protein
VRCQNFRTQWIRQWCFLSTCSPGLLGDWSLCQLVSGESYERLVNLDNLTSSLGMACAGVGGLIKELGLAVKALIRHVGC